MDNNYLDKKVDNFIDLISFNDSICLTGEFGSGKTFFIEKAKEKLTKNNFIYCEINAIFNQENIPLEIIKSIKKTVNKKLLVNTMGLGLFLFNLSRFLEWIIMIILPTGFSLLANFFISDYSEKSSLANFKFIFSITLLFIDLFLFIVWLISVRMIRIGSLDELEKIKIKNNKEILFIIEDLNRIEVPKQYEFLNNFLISFNKLQLISKKKFIIIMDKDQFKNNYEFEILKNFDYIYNLVYNYSEKKQIINDLIEKNNIIEKNEKAVINLWEILNNKGVYGTSTNLEFILSNFNNLRAINHIISKIFSFCKITNFTKFVNINDFFVFRVLEYYDSVLYNIVLKIPRLLTSSLEELEKGIYSKEFSNIFFENSLDKENKVIKEEYQYFFNSIFKHTFSDNPEGEFHWNCTNPDWKELISITDVSTFEIFVNKKLAEEFIGYLDSYKFNANIYDFDAVINEFESYNYNLRSFFNHYTINDYYQRKFWFFFTSYEICYKVDSLKFFKEIINKSIFYLSFTVFDYYFNNYFYKILVENEKFVEDILDEISNEIMDDKNLNIWNMKFISLFYEIIKALPSIKEKGIDIYSFKKLSDKYRIGYSEENNLELIKLAKNNCSDLKFINILEILSEPTHAHYLLNKAYSMGEYKELISNELNDWKSWKKCEILYFKFASKSILNYHSKCNCEYNIKEDILKNENFISHTFFSDFKEILIDIVNQE